MTRRLGRGDVQRGRARLTLTIVTLLTVGLLLGLSPAGPLSSVMAEVNGTPTSTTTETNAPGAAATPSNPSGPQIELLNPSGYSDPVIISNKADTDTSYHLVAWVGNVGGVTNPVVEFEITPGGTRIPASRIGETDTWHAFWTSLPADGEYEVFARLYGTSATTVPVDSDSQEVEVDKARETVEMTYPKNAEPLGIYDPFGAADVGFVVDATVSADATGVQVFYSTSPPGTEPNWRPCAQQVTVSYSTAGNRRIGCTAAAAHFTTPESPVFELKSIAIVPTGIDDFDLGPPPNCTPPDLDPGPPPVCPTVDAGDAHRVFPYKQTASGVTISPPTVTAARNTCQELTATVVDGQQRPIWRAEVDVHAVGPTDGLQFGAIPGRTRDWQPADGPGHQGPEPTSNCGESGTPPAQSEHERPAPEADPKHIESKPADEDDGGADTSGAFTFALRSPEQGATTVEAWADPNENDTRDTEPAGGATINWTGPSATRSVTSSPSQSASASTSPTATRSATATRSPTATGSPTGSPTSGPGPAARSITLETSKSTVVFGKRVDFSGIVDSQSAPCEAGQTVRIQKQTVGAEGFSEVTTVVTDSAGVYRLSLKPAENASYRSIVDPSASCQEAISATRPMAVRVKVGLRASDRRVRRGAKVTFRAKVAPCGVHGATDVVLFRRVGRRSFQEIGRKGLSASCRATFKSRVRKDATFQARWPSQDNDHQSGVSPKRKVQVRARGGRRNF